MGDKDIKPLSRNCNGVGPVRYMRDFPPAHFTFKIESFSLLSKTQVEKYESGDFESGGYKWRLSLYPTGDKTRNGDGHISLYLSISNSSTLPLGWEVRVNYKLFVYDQMRDKYLTIHDSVDNSGGIRRFHSIKEEWGFPQLITLDTFKKASNGYLVNDSCMFGAEVFVIKCSGKWECLSMVKEPDNSTYSWKISNFSTFTNEFHFSEKFKVGKSNWRLKVYPKGNSSAKGKSLSLYLELDDLKTLPPNRKLYAEFKLRIRDEVTWKHHERIYEHWFCASAEDSGFGNFISLSDLNQASKGYIKNDTLIVEAEFMVLSEVKNFP